MGRQVGSTAADALTEVLSALDTGDTAGARLLLVTLIHDITTSQEPDGSEEA